MLRRRHFLVYVLSLFILLLLGTACGNFPRDPQRSLNRVLAGGTLRVGVMANAPWVTGEAPGPPGGIEAELVSAFADELGVSVAWHWNGADELFTALTRYELDIVIGGTTKSSPWQQQVAFTLPYYTSNFIVGMPPGVPPVAALDGLVVAVRPTSPVRGELRDRGAIVMFRDNLAGSQSAVAAEEWEVTGLGFLRTTTRLQQDEHVMALPRGENALLMRLEQFLLEQTSEAAIAERLWAVASQ